MPDITDRHIIDDLVIRFESVSFDKEESVTDLIQEAVEFLISLLEKLDQDDDDFSDEYMLRIDTLHFWLTRFWQELDDTQRDIMFEQLVIEDKFKIALKEMLNSPALAQNRSLDIERFRDALKRNLHLRNWSASWGTPFDEETIKLIITTPGKVDDYQLKRALLSVIYTMMTFNRPQSYAQYISDYYKFETVLLHFMQHFKSPTKILWALKEMETETSHDVIKNYLKVVFPLVARSLVGLFGREAVIEGLHDCGAWNYKGSDTFTHIIQFDWFDSLSSIGCTEKEICNLYLTFYGEKRKLDIKEIGLSLTEFMLLKKHFIKMSQKGQDRISGEAKWAIFWQEFKFIIKDLYEFFGASVFKWLKSKIVSNEKPLIRLLTATRLTTRDLLPILAKNIKRILKHYGHKPAYYDELYQVILLVGCCQNLEGNGIKINTKMLVNELFDKLDLKAKKSQRIQALQQLRLSLAIRLIRLVISEDTLKKYPNLLDKPDLSIDTHQLIQLSNAHLAMSDSDYGGVFIELMLRDLFPELGKPMDYCHGTNGDDSEHPLVKHNDAIQAKLAAKGIQSRTYNRVLDVVIKVGQHKVNTEEKYRVLMSYLKQAVEATNRLNGEAYTEYRTALYEQYQQLNKIIAKRGLLHFSKSKARMKLLFDINDKLSELVEVTNADSTSLHDDVRRVNEFIKHYQDQLMLIKGSGQERQENPKSNLTVRVQQWNKNDPRTSYLGNYVGCCLATNSTDFSALVQRRMDDAMQFFVATNLKTGDPIALLWIYFAEDNEGKVYLVINFPEVTASYGQQPAIRRTLLSSLLLFANGYLEDNPGIEGLLMNDPGYGWNQDDFDGFHRKPMPAQFDKLGGPYIPGYSFDEDTIQERRKATGEAYYLASLDCSYLLRYTKFAHLKSLPLRQVVYEKELVAQAIISSIAVNKLKEVIKSATMSRDEVQELLFAISKFGIVDKLWELISIEVEAHIASLLGDFFENDTLELRRFIAAQRECCKLTHVIPPELQSCTQTLTSALIRERTFTPTEQHEVIDGLKERTIRAVL